MEGEKGFVVTETPDQEPRKTRSWPWPVSEAVRALTGEQALKPPGGET